MDNFSAPLQTKIIYLGYAQDQKWYGLVVRSPYHGETICAVTEADLLDCGIDCRLPDTWRDYP